jgi:hypothetical protein
MNYVFRRRHDIEHNDTQHNSKLNKTLSITPLCRYSECHLCKVFIMLSVANKPIMPSVIMLNVDKLSVVMLSVVMLNVVAPVRSWELAYLGGS